MRDDLSGVRRKSVLLVHLVCLVSLTGCVSEELEQRVTVLQEQTGKLDKSLTSLEVESTGRIAQIRDGIKAEAVQNKADRDHLLAEVNGRLDEVYRQVEIMRRDLIDNMQKANGSVVKSVDDRLSTLDVLIGTILLRIEELERRSVPSKK